MGLLFAALLYLPGMIWFDSQVMDSFFRWWVVHLWVEGVWELIMGGILSLIIGSISLTQQYRIKRFITYSGILNIGSP